MNVTTRYETRVLRLWFMLHHTHDLIKICEDQLFPRYGITTEQYSILITIKYGNVRPTDIARWLARSPNSVSMIIDRMVRVGLVRRIRDRTDRRVVHVAITSKGESILRSAHIAGWRLMRAIFTPLSDDNMQILLELLAAIQKQATERANPNVDIEEITIEEEKDHARLYEWLLLHASPDVTRAKSQEGKKIKAAV